MREVSGGQVRPLFLIFLTNSSICLSLDLMISYNLPNLSARICKRQQVPRPALSEFTRTCPCGPAAQPPPSLACCVKSYLHLFKRVLFLLFLLLPYSQGHFWYFRPFGHLWRDRRTGSLFREGFSEYEDQLFDFVGDSISQVLYVFLGEDHF